MWFKQYKDYPIDQTLKKEPLNSNQGFNGCEMHELNGWGSTYDLPPTPPVKKGGITTWLKKLFWEKKGAG